MVRGALGCLGSRAVFRTGRYTLVTAGGMLVAVGGRGLSLLWGKDVAARALKV